MYNKIKLLPEDTINKLSQGESLWKLFHIIKELLENSLDAKSNLIKLYFINKGISLIKLIDNGIGMDKNNLLNSIKRNYTNKIYLYDDLNNLKYFGFRGLSLYYISIMSYFKIISKNISSEIGWCLYNYLYKNIVLFNIKPIPSNLGTIVFLKKIFFNIKFKRQELLNNINKEWYLLNNFLNKFIICNYKTSFYIYSNKKLYKKYIYINNCKKVNILNVISSIYGNKFIENNIYINLYTDFWLCYGFFFINFNKNSKIKIIFLNKRLIDSKNILFYIFNKFLKGFLLEKFFNISYILYFFIDYKYINININNIKTLIDFKNINILYKSIYSNLLLYFKRKNIFSNIEKLFIYKNRKKCKNNNINLYLKEVNKKNYLQYFLIHFGKIITFISHKYLITIKKKKVILTNINYIFYYINYFVFKNKLLNFIWLNNISLEININLIINNNFDFIKFLYKLGIYIIYINSNILKIYKIPMYLININLKKFLFNLILFINKNINQKNLYNKIIYWFMNFIFLNKVLNTNTSIILITNFCKIIKFIKFDKNFFKIIDLYNLISYIKKFSKNK